MKFSARSLDARSNRHARCGISAIEVVIMIAAAGLTLSLALPWILSVREAARSSSCRHNLQRLGTALLAYHDAQRSLPAAGIWSTSRLESLALHKSRRVDLYTQSNWAQALLPFADETGLAAQFHSDLSIGDPQNERARNTRIPLMICPSDSFNLPENPFQFELNDREAISFARGNYAINGGSSSIRDGVGSTAFLTGDAAHLTMELTTREFRFWGNGVAGFNVCFSRDDFENGESSLVLLEEVRAGIHPIDPRGVWALGQIAGSVTWSHGVNGDANCPNSQEPRADDLLDGDRLHKTVGAVFLRDHRMPCVSYVDFNSQATARSSHNGGVNLLMVDGSSRFVGDAIDPGLWHVLHSRETPRNVLSGDMDAIIHNSTENHEQPAGANDVARLDHNAVPQVENSLGMLFALVPAGEFEMGLPDRGNDHDLPNGSPQHVVRISHPFYLGVHEITHSEYVLVTGESPTNLVTAGDQRTDPGNYPVTQVTWNDSDKFCQTLSVLAEEQAAGRRYRLPTEAEWEYACRAGRKTPYEWSRTRRPKDDSGDAGGIEPSLPLRPVGSFPPNAFGLFDMRGNVWEWCADWFDRDYYSRSPTDNPLGPRDGYIKVIRGNCWTFVGEGCKLSYPMMPPWKASPFVGFRVVCEFSSRRDVSAAKAAAH